MTADRGISPQRARRLAHHLEQAAHSIEQDRRAALYALASVSWAVPSELAAIAGLPDRLHSSAKDVRRRARDIEHQKVRKFACFSPPHRHASNPVFSFARGVWAGTTGTVRGVAHVLVSGAATPVQMADAAVHLRSPMAVLDKKIAATAYAFWQSRITFWRASGISLALETRKHGLATAVDEWAYANGEIVPFVAATVATSGGASPLAAGLARVGLPAAVATTTSEVVSLASKVSPPPLPYEPPGCEPENTKPKKAA